MHWSHDHDNAKQVLLHASLAEVQAHIPETNLQLCAGPPDLSETLQPISRGRIGGNAAFEVIYSFRMETKWSHIYTDISEAFANKLLNKRRERRFGK